MEFGQSAVDLPQIIKSIPNPEVPKGILFALVRHGTQALQGFAVTGKVVEGPGQQTNKLVI